MKYRRRYEQAVLNTFRRWLDGDLPRTPSGSRLHKAITYTLSRWTALVCYVQNIRLPVDNNRAENVIRQGGGEEELAVCRFATGESACRRHYARTAALPGKSLRLWEG
jgi:hypothetical protein